MVITMLCMAAVRNVGVHYFAPVILTHPKHAYLYTIVAGYVFKAVYSTPIFLISHYLIYL